MRSMPITVAVVLFALLAGAKTDESLDALKTRATSAKPADQGPLFARIARLEVNEADRFYTDGDLVNAKKAVTDVVDYAARAADVAGKTRKHEKATEILLRETARRLEDVRRTLNFEDRADVETAVQSVEKSRQQLLEQMFGMKGKHAEK